MQRPLTCFEICAGAGGQFLVLSLVGFTHVVIVEYEADCCKTLSLYGGKGLKIFRICYWIWWCNIFQQ